jgi:hypothetical protein
MGDIGAVAGGLIAQQTAEESQNKALAATQAAVDQINAIGAGPDLAKQIFLQQYKQAGVLTPQSEQAINAHFQQIAGPTQQVQNAQQAALQQFGQESQSGLNAQDRLALSQIQTQSARQNEAQQNAIIQNLAARGQAGGGAELAARLQAGQSGSNNANQQSLQVAAQAQNRALQALGQYGNYASGLANQQFSQNQANANIANEQNRFNTQNQQAVANQNVQTGNAAQAANLAQAQAIANANTGQANQESVREVQAQQQMYQNRMAQAQAAANARIGQGTQIAGFGATNAAGQAAMFGAGGNAANSIGQYIAGQYGKSGSGVGNGTIDNYDANTTYAGSSPGPWASSSPVSSEAIMEYQGGRIPEYNSGGYVAGGPNEYCEGGRLPMQEGGNVPGHAKVPGNSPKNDTVPAWLSPGEVVIPRSIAHSPEKSKKFIDLLHKKEEGVEKADHMNPMEHRPDSSMKNGYSGSKPTMESTMHKANRMNSMEKIPASGGGNGYASGGMAHYDVGGVVDPPSYSEVYHNSGASDYESNNYANKAKAHPEYYSDRGYNGPPSTEEETYNYNKILNSIKDKYKSEHPGSRYADGGEVQAPMSMPDGSTANGADPAPYQMNPLELKLAEFKALQQSQQNQSGAPQSSTSPTPVPSSQVDVPGLLDRVLGGIAMGGQSGGGVAPTSDNTNDPNHLVAGQDMSNEPGQIVASPNGQNIFDQRKAQMQSPKAVQDAAEQAKNDQTEGPKPEPVTAQSDVPKADEKDKDQDKKPMLADASDFEEVQSDAKPNYNDALKEAYKKADLNKLFAGLSHAQAQFLAGGARTRPDYSAADELAKEANQPVERVGQTMKVDEAQEKMDFNKQLSDPNSKVSNLFQQYLVKRGFASPESVQGLSADAASKFAPLAVKDFLATQAGDIKKSIAGQNIDSKKDIQTMKGQQGKELAGVKSEAKGFDLAQKNVKALNDSKDAIDKANDLVNKIAADPNRTSVDDAAAIQSAFQSIRNKGQGTGSRMGNIFTSGSALNTTAGNIENELNGLVGSKKTLTPETLQRIKALINQVKAESDQKYNQNIQVEHDAYVKRGGKDEDFSKLIPKQQSNKPSTVTQGGHTYTLNPQTGQYE